MILNRWANEWAKEGLRQRVWNRQFFFFFYHFVFFFGSFSVFRLRTYIIASRAKKNDWTRIVVWFCHVVSLTTKFDFKTTIPYAVLVRMSCTYTLCFDRKNGGWVENRQTNRILCWNTDGKQTHTQKQTSSHSPKTNNLYWKLMKTAFTHETK